ncbi:MAG: hypothetical protein E7449_03170 [Ruminococcaceae bacterium]|nr:hypothetical protein [Oscillospiraceae bacterium]
MQQSVALQSLQFVLCGALGLALAVFYDALRALRRECHVPAWIADLLFCLGCLASMLLFALYPGRGEFRLFMFLGLILGSIFYFLTLSGPILHLLSFLLRIILIIIGFLCFPIKFLIKKFYKISFSLFSRVKKWFRMRLVIKCAFYKQRNSEGEASEVPQIVTSVQIDHSGTDCICHRYPDFSANADHGHAFRIPAARKRDRLADRAEHAADRPDRSGQHHRGRHGYRPHQAWPGHGRRDRLL